MPTSSPREPTTSVTHDQVSTPGRSIPKPVVPAFPWLTRLADTTSRLQAMEIAQARSKDSSFAPVIAPALSSKRKAVDPPVSHPTWPSRRPPLSMAALKLQLQPGPTPPSRHFGIPSPDVPSLTVASLLQMPTAYLSDANLGGRVTRRVPALLSDDPDAHCPYVASKAASAANQTQGPAANSCTDPNKSETNAHILTDSQFERSLVAKQRRLLWARHDTDLFLCKYLPIDLPPRINPPPHQSGPAGVSPAILDAMRICFGWSPPAPRRPRVLFRNSLSAAERNFCLLRKCGMDFESFIQRFGGTPLALGSEFKPIDLLQLVFGRHVLWPRVRHMLMYGASPDVAPISESDRISDLKEALARGNHKSADSQPHALEKLMLVDIKYGYGVPLPRKRALQIPGLVLLPAGIALQNTISEFGEVIPKDRLTHDQSFHFSSKQSFNSRVDKHLLTHLRYGRAMSRFIHYIVDFRFHHPTVVILLAKSDYKAAYRRIHQAIHLALQCGLILNDDIIIILTRLSFGGAPNPSLWSDLAEMACDLVNELLCSRDWQVEEFLPFLPCPMPEPRPAQLETPLGKAARLSVTLERNDFGKCEVFIDDMFLAIPDLFDNVHRARHVLAIVISLLERPVQENEGVLRDCLLSLKKFAAEGTLEEDKVILGWRVDAHNLVLALPDDKFLAWTASIQHIIDRQGATTVGGLETLEGRLTNLGSIVPAARHFQGQLRNQLRLARKRSPKKETKWILPKRLWNAYFQLWLKILDKARIGFSMNNLVFRVPTREHSSDSCLFGIGHVNFTTGKGYRWLLPSHLQFALHINPLEFAGSLLGLLLDDDIGPQDCILSKTDSSTVEGWLQKTNFSAASGPGATSHAIAEGVGHDMMDRGYCLYSQHWPGEENIVSSDQLSHMHGSSRGDLEDLLDAATVSRDDAVTEGTHKKLAMVQKRWRSFLEAFELTHDPFLDSFEPNQKVLLLGAFAEKVRRGDFTPNFSPGDTPLMADTAKEHIDYLAQAFANAERPDPRLDPHGRLSSLLSRQWKGYRHADRATEPQKAITCSILKRMWHQARTPAEKGLARLAIGAFFFAMRSCEYLKVSGSERKTRVLRVENIRFFHNGREVSHSSVGLARCDVVSIIFVSQKSGVKDQTITMYRTDDPLLCPVKAWAGIVQAILADPTTSPRTSVNWCRVPLARRRASSRSATRVHYLTGDAMRTLIRSAASSIGKDRLGFDPNELGTHSIRSGAAMSMHLDGVPTYTIMLIGRWSSDAFLRYIRVQVMQFGRTVASRMIKHQDFFSIPDFDPVASSQGSAQVARASPFAPHSSVGGRVLTSHSSSLNHGAIRAPFAIHV